MSANSSPMQGFDEASQRELSEFLENEQAKAKMQASIHTFTSMCWDKCITGSISARFSRNEESCLVNCADRFLDSSLLIVNTIEKQRQQMGQ